MKITGRCAACRQVVTQDDSVSHWRSEESGVLCQSAPELPNRGRYHTAEPLETVTERVCPNCGSEEVSIVPLKGYLPNECDDCGHLFSDDDPNLNAYEED